VVRLVCQVVEQSDHDLDHLHRGGRALDHVHRLREGGRVAGVRVVHPDHSAYAVVLGALLLGLGDAEVDFADYVLRRRFGHL
jgi:hypothetical protein